MDNIHITILSPSEFSGTSGDTANFMELINQFLVEGLKVLLICPKSNKTYVPKFESNNENFKMIRINCKPPRLNEMKHGVHFRHYFEYLWFLFVETITLLRLIRTEKITRIYVRHSILTMHLPILFKIFRIKTVADGEVMSDLIRDLMNPTLLKLFTKYEKRIINYYTYFKVSTNAHKRDLEKLGIAKEKIVIIPVSINTMKIPKFDIEQIPENTYGYFGGLESWQGIEILLHSFQLLLKKVPTSILYIIGDGTLMQKFKEWVGTNRLESKILFVGKVSREKLWYEYFDKFRIVVIPRQKMNNSIDTILPIKLVESMAACKPIIAMDIPVMREIPSNPLILVKSGNPQLLAESMLALSSDINELRHRVQLSFEASKSYDIKNNIKKLISILNN